MVNVRSERVSETNAPDRDRASRSPRDVQDILKSVEKRRMQWNRPWRRWERWRRNERTWTLNATDTKTPYSRVNCLSPRKRIHQCLSCNQVHARSSQMYSSLNSLPCHLSHNHSKPVNQSFIPLVFRRRKLIYSQRRRRRQPGILQRRHLLPSQDRVELLRVSPVRHRDVRDGSPPQSPAPPSFCDSDAPPGLHPRLHFPQHIPRRITSSSPSCARARPPHARPCLSTFPPNATTRRCGASDSTPHPCPPRSSTSPSLLT